MSDLPLVAIVGRPNVGKSTLVNRIIGRREAIVEERPGVTRDRKEVEAEWYGQRFRVADTGGWMVGEEGTLTRKVSAQAELAIKEADVVVMVVDVTIGVTDDDERVARLLQDSGTPVVLVANKVDNDQRELEMWEFVGLGLGNPLPVSAMHGRGSADLLDTIVSLLPQPEEAGAEVGVPETDGEGGEFSVAIVGRPNVGKSTLFNRMVGEERSVVHDMPGTTRDTIDTVVETEDGAMRFVDTAGMRRRSRVDETTEYYGVVRSLQAVDRADAVLLIVDASEGVTHQDQRLAERVDAAGCAVTILLNKWDVANDEQRRRVEWEVADRLGFLAYAPVLKVSALTGKSVQRILPALWQAREEYHRRVPTAQLNRVVQEAQRAHPAPTHRGVRPRVLYATQGAIDPPTFTLFANRRLPAPYLRYLERKIREAFHFGATPIKVRVRTKR
ncbi:MAG TPA: ribosome biogenesis GTPase Der [Acidimicrobiia bacterium]|nr:ribosome biogenesis GTPase Der [Acidimicrobiia bacterium]